ncbi:hypothetical protein F5Y10DRAFT_193768 [Nemania abortiva]|nr:hypothetical protein F5Y10DRAFT_193768 [Nemania abortiva]
MNLYRMESQGLSITGRSHCQADSPGRADQPTQGRWSHAAGLWYKICQTYTLGKVLRSFATYSGGHILILGRMRGRLQAAMTKEIDTYDGSVGELIAFRGAPALSSAVDTKVANLANLVLRRRLGTLSQGQEDLSPSITKL